MPELVDNDTFLVKLRSLFEETKSKGTVWLTHKRLTYGTEESGGIKQEDETTEYPCLLRASNGGKIKFSTRIDSSDLQKFHTVYGSLLKSALTATLRKRDKKREKQRAEETAKRKKRMTENLVVEGPKRGKGRRKRQRLVKAKIRQEESQRKYKEKEEGKKVIANPGAW